MDLVDLCDPGNFVEAVPHETFTQLRKEAPVYWHEEAEGPGFWCLTRHAEVSAVNRDNITFSSYRGGALFLDHPPDMLEQQRLMMLNMDPPMHTRYRLLVNKGFTPRRINELEQHIRQMTNDIVDTICEKGECDFVNDVAAELPLQVIAELVGVPQDDRHLVFDWSNRMVGANDPEYNTSAEKASEAAMELYGYAHELAARKQQEPGQDLITALLNAEVDGEKLTELELDMFFLLLAVAGNETTRNGISHGMLALIENPDEYKKLVEDPGLINSAVEEMLRWGSPVMHFRRTATKDTEIGGQSVKEGDKIVFWHISANRDEAVFDDPFRFDITRDPNDHIAFGAGGPHFCLGANLARMEMRVMFDELFKRLPDIELGGDVQRLRSNFINGIKHMPVKFEARPRASAAA